MNFTVKMEEYGGAELVLIEIEQLVNTSLDDASFHVKLAVIRGETSAYNRVLHHVNLTRTSPLGLLQAVLDEIPEEAQQLA